MGKEYIIQCRYEWKSNNGVVWTDWFAYDTTTYSEDAIETALKTERNNCGYLRKYVENFDLPQKKLIYRFKDNALLFSSSEYSDCGHGINFKRYSNKNTCFICDLKSAFNGTIF